MCSFHLFQTDPPYRLHINVKVHLICHPALMFLTSSDVYIKRLSSLDLAPLGHTSLVALTNIFRKDWQEWGRKYLQIIIRSLAFSTEIFLLCFIQCHFQCHLPCHKVALPGLKGFYSKDFILEKPLR